MSSYVEHLTPHHTDTANAYTHRLSCLRPIHTRDWRAVIAEIKQIVAASPPMPLDTLWRFTSRTWAVSGIGLSDPSKLESFLKKFTPRFNAVAPRPKVKGNDKQMSDKGYEAALRTTPELLQADESEIFRHITLDRLVELLQLGLIGDKDEGTARYTARLRVKEIARPYNTALNQ